MPAQDKNLPSLILSKLASPPRMFIHADLQRQERDSSRKATALLVGHEITGVAKSVHPHGHSTRGYTKLYWKDHAIRTRLSLFLGVRLEWVGWAVRPLGWESGSWLVRR